MRLWTGRAHVNMGAPQGRVFLFLTNAIPGLHLGVGRVQGHSAGDSGLALCLSLPFRISATILLNISPQSVGMFCISSLKKSPHCRHSPGSPDCNICIAFEIITNEVNFPQWMFLPALCVCSSRTPFSLDTMPLLSPHEWTS